MNSALHILLLGAGLAALPLWNHHFLIFTAFIWAALREQAQHRIKIGAFLFDAPQELRYYRISKRTFWDFGWLGWRQVREIAETTGGAALIVGAYDLWRHFG